MCSYGYVYDGIAEEVPLSWEKKVKVAVKKLTAEPTPQDRMMFMKEAILLKYGRVMDSLILVVFQQLRSPEHCERTWCLLDSRL